MAMDVSGVGRPGQPAGSSPPAAAWKSAVSGAAPPPGTAFSAHPQPQHPPPQPDHHEGGSWAQRGLGLLQTVGGVAETLAGGALILAPEPTMLTKVAGGAVAVHGVDDLQAGLRSLWTGKATPTVTQQAATAAASHAGASAATAEKVGIGVDLAAGVLVPIGAERLAARGVAARIAAGALPADAKAAGQAGKALDEAGGLAASTRATRFAAARAVVAAGGTATAADAAPAVNRLAHAVPASTLQSLEQAGVKVVVTQGTVTEHLTHLKGVTPRGWPPGSTWDQVAGLYNPATKEVVIATHPAGDAARRLPGADESGSADVLLHEVGHALNNTGRGTKPGGLLSDSKAFQDAYDADKASLGAYYQQAGSAGRDEAFAEGYARFLSNAAEMQRDQPSLYAFFHDAAREL